MSCKIHFCHGSVADMVQKTRDPAQPWPLFILQNYFSFLQILPLIKKIMAELIQ